MLGFPPCDTVASWADPHVRRRATPFALNDPAIAPDRSRMLNVARTLTLTL